MVDVLDWLITGRWGLTQPGFARVGGLAAGLLSFTLLCWLLVGWVEPERSVEVPQRFGQDHVMHGNRRRNQVVRLNAEPECPAQVWARFPGYDVGVPLDGSAAELLLPEGAEFELFCRKPSQGRPYPPGEASRMRAAAEIPGSGRPIAVMEWRLLGYLEAAVRVEGAQLTEDPGGGS